MEFCEDSHDSSYSSDESSEDDSEDLIDRWPPRQAVGVYQWTSDESSEDENEREMQVDNTGQWVNDLADFKFSPQNTRHEDINNIVKFTENDEVSVSFSDFRCDGMRILVTKEWGGPGFETEEGFKRATTYCCSGREELNNKGVGNKSTTLLQGYRCYTILKIDTQIGASAVWMSPPTEGIPRELDMKDEVKQYLMDSNKFHQRISISILGERGNDKKYRQKEYIFQIMSQCDGKSLQHMISPEDKDYTDLCIRYGDTPNLDIWMNGLQVQGLDTFLESSADHLHKDGFAKRPQYDEMNIDIYRCKAEVAAKIKPGNTFHRKITSKSDWLKTPIHRFQGKPKDIGKHPYVSLKLTITNLKKHTHRPDKKIYIGTRTCLISSHGPTWGNKAWPNIRVKIEGDLANLAEWIDLCPNKSLSQMKPEVEEIIEKVIDYYYLDGSSKKPCWSPAFHSDKYPDEGPRTCSTRARNRCWKNSFGDSEDGRCACCDKHIRRNKRGAKEGKWWEAGHILADKNGGTEDDCNMIPICVHCNKSMGDTHMTQFVSENWDGRENQRLYMERCITLKKRYIPP
jgi:hypothetical protein